MRYAGPLVAVVIVAEIIAAVAVADATSWGLVILLLLLLSLAGFALVRRELLAAVRARRGRSPRAPAGPGEQIADTVTGLGGALLVVIPGFLTGVAGLLLMLPPVRRAAQTVIGPRWSTRLRSMTVTNSRFRRLPEPDADVIEGQLARERPPVIDLSTSSGDGLPDSKRYDKPGAGSPGAADTD